MHYIYTRKGTNMSLLDNYLANIVKYNRNKLKLTQEEFAEKAGVGLRFIRDLEQGKESLRLDKVNQVLALFGHKVASTPYKIKDPYDILLNYTNHQVRVSLKDKTDKTGIILGQVMNSGGITGWRFVSNTNATEYQRKKDKGLEELISHTNIEEIENL
jgi:y4mF family transcriptional regulator